MTLDELVAQQDGKYVEVAGSPEAKNQCVDLANLYIRDVLKLPIIEWTNAIDFPIRVNPNDYDYILNTPTGVPQKGDLVIWKPSPGHIAIFLDGNIDKFRSFDENFPLNSVCHIQEHDYTNVIGWLHPKKTPVDTIAVPKADFERLVTKSSNYDSFVTAGFPTVADVNSKIKGMQDSINSIQSTSLSLQADNQSKDKQIQSLQSTVTSLNAQIDQLTEQMNNQPVSQCEALKIKLSDIKTISCGSWLTWLRSRNKVRTIIG